MKRSQVRALLRKASMWLECTHWCGGCEPLLMIGLFDHEAAASALLDGLDVRDVTEAGG